MLREQGRDFCDARDDAFAEARLRKRRLHSRADRLPLRSVDATVGYRYYKQDAAFFWMKHYPDQTIEMSKYLTDEAPRYERPMRAPERGGARDESPVPHANGSKAPFLG